MILRELPQGNGQVVYIEPEWLEKEYDANIFSLPNHDKVIVNKLVEHLCNIGYVITSDCKTVDDSAFFFNPCVDKHINDTKEKYVNKKNAMINECLATGHVQAPLTISFPENSFPNIVVEDLPIVIKNENEQGGREKFLIRTPEQLETFKRFYNEIDDYDKIFHTERAKREWNLPDDFKFHADGTSDYGLGISFANYKEILHENFVIQKYIKTPTKYNTSLRVITSSTGDILCASLKYAEVNKGEKRTLIGMFDEYLSNPESPYYLGDESIVSNTVAGGNSILLGRTDYSELEKEILLTHGIDSSNAVVPRDVVSAASKIAINGKRLIGAISGMDFILDEEEQAWKYLEQHEYPMLNTYAEAYGLPYDFESSLPNFYETHYIADTHARLFSLDLAMQKKQTLDIQEENRHRK